MKKLLILILLTAVFAACSAAPAEQPAAVEEPATLPLVSNEVVAEPSAAPSMSDGRNMMSDNQMGNGMMAEQGASAPRSMGTMLTSDEVLAQGRVESEEGDANAALAVSLATGVAEIADWLAAHPDWTASAWPDEEDGRYYSLELYSAAADEWLGWVYVNIDDQHVDDYFVPRELSAEEFQTGRDRVETFVLNDEAIKMRLGDITQWEHDTYYNRWDAVWEVYFWQGLDEVAVVVTSWEDELYIDEIFNPNELDEIETAENNENIAISLAWGAEGIDQALADSNNWQTYVSQQGETTYAVSFATAERELFFALVDIASEQVLESIIGNP